ncbi:MAG: two-component sensor histidine kinase [Clostridia bacterium]|nr:two-component sensor histidine kinase [Clostridia bacterium]
MKRSMKLRTKILLLFSLFALLILGLLWIFQVALFGQLFEGVRVMEGRAVIRRIEAALESQGTEALSESIQDAAFEKAACVSVYEIVNTVATRVADIHANENCRIHDIANMSELLHRLYIAAESDGGIAVERVAVSSFGSPPTDNRPSDTAFCARLLSLENGKDYLILANVEVYPSVATVAALREQLIWISAVIAVIAVAMAFLISGSLARPIAKLNQGAAQLAKGNYGADFSAPGYRETEELGNTLTLAAEELSRTEALRRELIANVSHDLRTPLTMIGGYAEIMRDIPGEVTAENLQIIVNETHRLSSLVNDLLDVSRLLSGTEVMQPTRFDLGTLAGEAGAHFRDLLSKNGYTIHVDAPEGVWVRGDRKRLQQVLYNLIGNAVNYTGEDKQVSIRLTAGDGIARFSVTDTGAGIPAEDLPKIWERYYKVDKVHKRAAVGTGLGLSIVKSVLDAHNAKFGVSSDLGEGSCFWFELPLA